MQHLRLVLAALLCLFAALPAHAHKLSYTEAWASFQADGTYAIDLFMDPRDVPEGGAVDNLDAVRDYWRDNVDLIFDGAEAEFEVTVPETGTEAAQKRDFTVVRLYGDIPYDAEHFVWTGREFAGTIVLNLRQQGDAAVIIQRLDPGKSSKPFPLKVAPERPGAFDVVGTYIYLGFTHIVPKGLDHIAFVLGLFLLSIKMRPLLWQITAFTVAHSVTLGLASAGVLTLSASIVEPLIALSIAYVAVENLLTTEMKPWRPVMVFAFGLLHGLGFAGVLGQIGLDGERFATSLVSFNVGVELGQLAIIGVAIALVGRYRDEDWYRSRIAVPGSVLIGLAGLWWTVERIFLS